MRFVALPVCLGIGIVGAYFVLSSYASTWNPVYDTNFADPSVVSFGGTYYGFATGNHIPSAVSSDAIHWANKTDALPNLASWATGPNWAPTVAYNASDHTFVMFYATIEKSNSKHCISKAVSNSPAGPYVDNSSGPFLCQPSLGGTIDPDIFQDSDGKLYLFVKNAGSAGGTYSALWVQPLTPSYALTGSLTMMLKSDQSWQGGIIEGPSMVKLGGTYYLFYAGNAWHSSRYAIGYATCPSPVSPCTEGHNNPVLGTTGSMVGPGSPDFFIGPNGNQRMDFHAFNGSISSHRALYEAAVSVSNGQPVLVPAQSVPSPTPTPPSPSPSCVPIIADVDHDCHVNATDLSILLSDWGTSTAAADLNHDGTVNLFDLSILLANWTG